MTAERLTAAMKEADELTEKEGVTVSGGKKYLMVKDRVHVLRRYFGLELGIETEILPLLPGDDPKLVRVRARITDASGRIIVSGHAEELRGSTNVNKTSALENGETSAIGRAISSVGISGGEYASLNEIEIARSHKAALDKKPEPEPEQNPVPTITVSKTNDPPFDDSDTHEVYDWPSWSATAKQEILAETTEGGLVRWNKVNRLELTKLKEERKSLWDDLFSHYVKTMNKAKLNEGKA